MYSSYHKGTEPEGEEEMSYYRVQQAAHPIEWLLDPEYQFSTSYVDDSVRTGVSVCESIEELAAYLAQVGIPFDDDCLLVELDGDLADDEDEDAHLGARLIIPTRIVSTELAGERLCPMILAAYDDLAA